MAGNGAQRTLGVRAWPPLRAEGYACSDRLIRSHRRLVAGLAVASVLGAVEVSPGSPTLRKNWTRSATTTLVADTGSRL